MIVRLRRSLLRNKVRVFTVILLITLSVYLGVTMSEFNRNMNSVYDDFYEETNLADLLVTDSEMPEQRFTELCLNHSDWKCEARLTLDGQTRLVNKTGEHWIRSTWHGMTENRVSTLYEVDGKMAPGLGEVVLDAHVANAHSMKVGDILELGAGQGMHNFTIVGIAYNPHHLWYMPEGNLFPNNANFVVAYFSADELARIAGFEAGTMNSLHIDLPETPDFDIASTTEINEGKELDEVREGLLSEMRDSGLQGDVVDRSGMKSPEMLRIDLEGSQKMTPFVLVILLLISGLVIAISIDRLVKSQAREIAVLRTVGTPGNEIRNVYMLIPLVLGIPGIILGILLGISPFGTKAFTEFYFSVFDMPVVKVHHYLDILLMIGLGSMALIFLFGIRPAFKAAKMQPMDVFGQSSEKAPNKYLHKVTQKLPPGIGLALRSTFRKPARLIVTLVALSLSMVILGGMMMMMAVFTEVFEENMDSQVNWQAQAMFWPEQVGDVESWAENNSSSFESVIITEASPINDDKSFALYGFERIATDDSDMPMHRLNLVNGDLPQSGKAIPEALIDEGMSILLDWQIGDTIEIEYNSSSVQVKVSGIVQEIERMMVLHRSDLENVVGYKANSVRMIFSNGQGIDDTLREVSIMTLEKKTLIEGFNAVLEQQQGAMQVMYGVGAILAIAVLFNTLLMNLAERDTELATLRVLGASRMRLATILTVEHAFIGLIGGIAGALASIAMMQGLTSMMTSWEFYIPMHVDFISALMVIGFVLFAALLTTPIGIWRIGKMNLLEVVARHER